MPVYTLQKPPSASPIGGKTNSISSSFTLIKPAFSSSENRSLIVLICPLFSIPNQSSIVVGFTLTTTLFSPEIGKVLLFIASMVSNPNARLEIPASNTDLGIHPQLSPFSVKSCFNKALALVFSLSLAFDLSRFSSNVFKSTTVFFIKLFKYSIRS